MPEDLRNESQVRQVEYCEQLDQQRTLIVMTMKQMAVSEQYLFGNRLHIVKAYGRRVWTRLWQAYQKGIKLAKEFEPDVIEYQDPKIAGIVAYLIARRLKLPLLGQMFIDYFDDKIWLDQRLSHYIYNQLGWFALRHSYAIKVQNRKMAENLRAHGINNTTKIPMYTPDLEKFVVSDATQRYRLQRWKHDPSIISIGRLTAQKNFPMLLEAFAAVYHRTGRGRIEILGQGELEIPLKHLAEKLSIGDRVQWIGQVPYEQVPEYLQHANIFALSSDSEGGPRVLLQAQTSRLPSVTTDVGWAPEIVQHNITGFITPVRDTGKFEQCLERLLTDFGVYSRMLALPQFVDHLEYGEAVIVGPMKAFYDGVAAWSAKS